MSQFPSLPFSSRVFSSELFLALLLPTAISQAGKRRLSLNSAVCLEHRTSADSKQVSTVDSCGNHRGKACSVTGMKAVPEVRRVCLSFLVTAVLLTVTGLED